MLTLQKGIGSFLLHVVHNRKQTLVTVHIMAHHKTAEPDGGQRQNHQYRGKTVQKRNLYKARRRTVPGRPGNQHHTQQQYPQQQLEDM